MLNVGKILELWTSESMKIPLIYNMSYKQTNTKDWSKPAKLDLDLYQNLSNTTLKDLAAYTK